MDLFVLAMQWCIPEALCLSLIYPYSDPLPTRMIRGMASVIANANPALGLAVI